LTKNRTPSKGRIARERDREREREQDGDIPTDLRRGAPMVAAGWPPSLPFHLCSLLTPLPTRNPRKDVAARVYMRGLRERAWDQGREKELLPDLASSLSSPGHGQGEDSPAPYPTTHGECCL
jgi:hypothetical protein